MAGAIACIVRRITEHVERYDLTEDPITLDSINYQLDLLQSHLVHLESPGDELVESIALCRTMLLDLEDTHNNLLVPLRDASRGRGRPKLFISQDQLEHLIDLNFSCPSIASMLGVSVRTVYRRMEEYSLSIRSSYSDMSDNELDETVASLKHHYPNAGYRMMSGLLLEEGIRLQQHRVRESLRRVDPLGVAMRWGEAIRRREYNVLSPLSLWHLDGNHKLIRCV